MTIRIIRMDDPGVLALQDAEVLRWLDENGVTHWVPPEATVVLRHGKWFDIEVLPWKRRPWRAASPKPTLRADERYISENDEGPIRWRTYRQRTPFPSMKGSGS